MSSVKVTMNPETGNVVNPTSNPEVAFVRVEQTKEVVINGWFQEQKRSALIMGAPEALEKKFSKGQVLPGTITIREDHEAAHGKQEPKINPTTGEILAKDGKPIYRHSEYNPNPNAEDGVMLQHDTVQVPEGEKSSKEREEADMSIT